MSMIWIILCLIISLVLFRVSLNKGITAYVLFYLGMIIFLLIGWISAYLLADEMYVLNGNRKILNNIIGDIILFFILSSIFLLLQKKYFKLNMLEFQKIQIPYNLINFIVYSTVIFCVLMLLLIDLKTAPLLNIGKYTYQDMVFYRNSLFSKGLIEYLNVPRYIVFYMVIPVIFLLRGMGYKISIASLFLFLFVSLLTLSKTMFILIVFFFYVGKLVYHQKKRYLLWMSIISIIGFYLIVFTTYYVDVRRGFFDVLKVFYIRLITTPIALSAIYADIFSFDQGIRSSEYYTYIFGGNYSPIPVLAMQHIVSTSSGNAPTGIIGMAIPNIPKYLKWLYYLVFIFYVFSISYLINYIKNSYIKIIIMVVFGILSWFIFLTDPLVAFNSYGLLYIGIGVIILLLITQKITW